MPFFSRDSRLKTFLKNVNDLNNINSWHKTETYRDDRIYDKYGNYNMPPKGGGMEERPINTYTTELLYFSNRPEIAIDQFNEIFEKCNKNCEYYRKACRIILNRFNNIDARFQNYERITDEYGDKIDKDDADRRIFQFYCYLFKDQLALTEDKLTDEEEEQATIYEDRQTKKREDEEAFARENPNYVQIYGGNRSHKKRKHKRRHTKRKNKRTRITRKNKRQQKSRRKI